MQKGVADIIDDSLSFPEKHLAAEAVINRETVRKVLTGIVDKLEGQRCLSGEHDVADSRHDCLRHLGEPETVLLEQRFGLLLDGENRVSSEANEENRYQEKENLEFQPCLDRSNQAVSPLFTQSEEKNEECPSGPGSTRMNSSVNLVNSRLRINEIIERNNAEQGAFVNVPCVRRDIESEPMRRTKRYASLASS
jgi:hypothetical protein